MEEIKVTKKLGVYLGRFNPVHLGHIAVFDQMYATYGWENSLVIIGSCNTPQSLRHFFTYAERKEFIKLIYHNIRVVGLPDYESNADWYMALCDLINITGHNIADVEFFTGCQEDVNILGEWIKDFTVLNRFDGTTPKVSATEVRDALLHERSLDGLVHPKLKLTLPGRFKLRWNEFQKK